MYDSIEILFFLNNQRDKSIVSKSVSEVDN